MFYLILTCTLGIFFLSILYMVNKTKCGQSECIKLNKPKMS